MAAPFLFGFVLLIALLVWVVRSSRRNARLQAERAKYIAEYAFPSGLRFKLDQRWPELSGEQVGMILEGLRTWFQLLAANPRARLGMPSQAVDSAWHEFILFTQNYADFCDHAFGYFLHHVPNTGNRNKEMNALARTYGLGTGLAGGAVLAAGVAGAASLGGHDLFGLDQTLGLASGQSYSEADFAELQQRYQQMQSSGDAGSPSSGGTHESSGDGAGSDGGGGGSSGCGGGGGGGGGGGCGS